MAAFRTAHEQGRLVALPTSGTSRRPRHVVRDTASWISSFDQLSARTGLDATSRVWVPGPLSATMNLFTAVHAAWVGATVLAAPDAVSHAQLTPSLLMRALDDDVGLSGVSVVVAGDRLHRALADRAAKAGADVVSYYGAAELSFVAWGSCADDLQPFPGVHVEIRNGEIWARSPYLCLGYVGYGRAAGALRRTKDGLATVGDRGRLDGNLLTVLGRGDAVVTTAGATVHVGEIESILAASATGEVAVIGLPHSVHGRVVAAVLTDESDFAPLRDTARDILDPAARPRLWFALERLPTNRMDKIDHTALTELVSVSGRGVRRLT